MEKKQNPFGAKAQRIVQELKTARKLKVDELKTARKLKQNELKASRKKAQALKAANKPKVIKIHKKKLLGQKLPIIVKNTENSDIILPNTHNDNNVIGISLGNTCYPAHWAVKNNLRKQKHQGYKTCPFDLMVSNCKGIIECIKDDFKYFCDLKYLTYNENAGGVRNTYYNFGFNHETPGHADLYLKEKWPEGTNHYVNNNFKHFIKRYNERIQNLKNYLNNKEHTIIFCIKFTYDSNKNSNLIELKNALNNKYPDLKYKILVLSDDKNEIFT